MYKRMGYWKWWFQHNGIVVVVFAYLVLPWFALLAFMFHLTSSFPLIVGISILAIWISILFVTLLVKARESYRIYLRETK